MKSMPSFVRVENNFMESSKFIPMLSISGEILTPTINDSGTTFFIDLNISNRKRDLRLKSPPQLSFLIFVFSLPKWFQTRWNIIDTWTLIGINTIDKNIS